MLRLQKNVSIANAEYNLSQESDSCDSNNLGQNLLVTFDDAGAGHYIILSTERWALDIDDIDEFAAMLKSIAAQIGEEPF